MALIGYARVSTEDQTPRPQVDALSAAGCAEVHQEQASGGDRGRPVLARVLKRMGRGDTLIVDGVPRTLEPGQQGLLDALREVLAQAPRPGPVTPEVPFRGGLVGVGGFDVVRRCHAALARI